MKLKILVKSKSNVNVTKRFLMQQDSHDQRLIGGNQGWEDNRYVVDVTRDHARNQYLIVDVVGICWTIRTPTISINCRSTLHSCDEPYDMMI